MDSSVKKAPVTFFTQFKNLCRHVTSELKNVKGDLDSPVGSYPANYYVGMNTLNSLISEIKEDSRIVSEDLKLIQEFTDHVSTMQDSVDIMAEKINKMEAYFAKYGYEKQDIPIEPEIKVEHPVETVASSTVESASKLKSPILSEFGKLVIQGRDLPHCEPYILTPRNTRNYEFQEEKSETFDDDIDEPPITNSVKKRVSDWLLNIPSENNLTPDKSHGNSLNQDLLVDNYSTNSIYSRNPRNKEGRNNNLTTTPECSVNHNPPVKNRLKYDGVRETFVSSQPNNLKVNDEINKGLNQNTPETPILSINNFKRKDFTYSKNPHNFSSTSANCNQHLINTPEEPSISYRSYRSEMLETKVACPKETPEEPSLLYRKNLCAKDEMNQVTPEEPHLRYNYLKEDTRTGNVTPEEPSLSTKYIQDHMNWTSECNMPEEPVVKCRREEYIHMPKEPVMKYRKEEYNHMPEEPVVKYSKENDYRRRESQYEYDKQFLVIGQHEAKNNCNKSNNKENVHYNKNNLSQVKNTREISIPNVSDLPKSPELSDTTINILKYRF